MKDSVIELHTTVTPWTKVQILIYISPHSQKHFYLSVLEVFKSHLLQAFACKYEGPLKVRLERDMVIRITTLSQKHSSEKIWRSY